MDSSDESHDGPQDGKTPASTLDQKRRAQKAIFDQWLSSASGQEALASKPKDAGADDTVADEKLSIHALMIRAGGEIIKNPRDYQLELFERAKQENTIAVLDTGSGKTLIAALLIRWTIDQELEDRASGRSGRIAFFLVNSVTLAFQQHSVLETNLDHEVLRICGADNPDGWPVAKWRKTFDENKVIVCTADVLHRCLFRSYLRMRDINLLIFDEAHHTKKNHPYARIMKDFYLAETDDACRPRIFGMTASPIDAKTDVVQAATELEALLHSKIATTVDMSLTQSSNKPQDSILRYSALPHRADSSLLADFSSRFGHVGGVVDKKLTAAKEVARHLGSWCAHEALFEVFSEQQHRKHEVKVEKTFHAHSTEERTSVKTLDGKLAELRQVTDFIRNQPRQNQVTDRDMSSKVRELYKFLSLEFERPSDHRCIVFVEQRNTARLLTALFQNVGLEHLKPAFLIGSGGESSEEDNSTFRKQVMTLIKFRQGELNCLFATNVAEEGLDVPTCNLIIRFDLYRTMIQYVQSRGRAREQNSRFVHMVEFGNIMHDQLVLDVRHAEVQMRRFCEALPEDRKLIGNADALEALLSKEKATQVYTDPVTNAQITYGNSLAILAHFVSAIPNETDEPMHPTYIVTSRGPLFMAEVLLPGNAPLRSKLGSPLTKKSLAKRSAAFEACLELRAKKFLDQHLLPTYQKRLPAMRNALLATGLNKKTQYKMRVKPKIWETGRGTLPAELYLTIIDFPQGLQEGARQHHHPLGLLTRGPLPQFPEFPIFLNDGRSSVVASKSIGGGMNVKPEQLVKLSAFTFRVFNDVFSKKYGEDSSQLSYWLTPVMAGYDDNNVGGVTDQAIDWTIVDEVCANQEYQWTPEMPPNFLIGRFLVDRWDGSRKFYCTGLATDLQPMDPLPEGVAKSKWTGGNILNYTVSLYRNARQKATWNTEQPVLIAEAVLNRRNMLAAPAEKETKASTKAYLCPEPLKCSALPSSVVTSCFALPAIIHRFESYLIALEACEMVGVSCDPAVALAAVTKDSDNSDEHENQQRINFQSGMGQNYERLEFIGDTFLKTATTISTFIQNPNDDEFEFHVKRMLLLCNKNLFNVAIKLGLHEFIRSMSFTRRIWYPEGLVLLEGKGANQQAQVLEMNHSLGQKTIADVSEALIGAAYTTGDRPGHRWDERNWVSAIRAVSKLVGNEAHNMQTWNDYRVAAHVHRPAYLSSAITASQRDLAMKVEQEHPYRFRYPQLLRSAFIHPSQPFSYERVPNYQRLEFLGDALLDMASITYLFNRYPDKDPQWLTEHKMAMVSNKFLGCVCINTGFFRHLRYASSSLEPQIREYAAELLDAKKGAGGSPDYWTTVSDPPKCLPDIVESYVGAIFVDSDFDFNPVQDFFNRHIKCYFEDMKLYDTFANAHPCTHLHNLLQTTYGCEDYRLMARDIPTVGSEMDRVDVVAVVMIHSEVMASAKGKSGRYARLRAANIALEIIKGLGPFQFRSRFGCNCHLREAKADVVDGNGADCTV